MWKKFNLESSVVKAGKVSVCRLRIGGYLDSSTFPKLQDHLSREIESENYNFLLDIEDLDYVSSAGLGVLMGIVRQVRGKKGDLKIVNMSEKIERVFNLLGFSRLMHVYRNEKEALDDFARPLEEQASPPSEGKKDTDEDY